MTSEPFHRSASARYRAEKHPERGGDGWVVMANDGRFVQYVPMPYPDAVILAERLNMHWERLRHWESDVLNPSGGN